MITCQESFCWTTAEIKNEQGERFMKYFLNFIAFSLRLYLIRLNKNCSTEFRVISSLLVPSTSSFYFFSKRDLAEPDLNFRSCEIKRQTTARKAKKKTFILINLFSGEFRVLFIIDSRAYVHVAAKRSCLSRLLLLLSVGCIATLWEVLSNGFRNVVQH